MAQQGHMVDWQAVRADYENGVGSLKEIGARYGVTRSAIAWRKKQQLWAPRSLKSAANRELIIKRMLCLFEKQVRRLEKKAEADSGTASEIVALAKSAGTLERLIQLEDATAREPEPSSSRDMIDLRKRLAERIEQLKRA